MWREKDNGAGRRESAAMQTLAGTPKSGSTLVLADHRIDSISNGEMTGERAFRTGDPEMVTMTAMEATVEAREP